ncbi:MAG: mechanosensitive ion channel family protein [Treponemataceae bacterium]|nr:mechanosensitive ion channel family protein [Treponemataceae bacterium]
MEETTTVLDTVKTAGTEAIQETWQLLHIDDLRRFITWENLIHVGVSVITILIFYIIYRIIKGIVRKRLSVNMKPVLVQGISKIISYVFYVLMVMYVLGLFGINLSAVWGAAGIAGVAIGFAAQTSVSNLISGLFVVTDKAMKIGDFIEVDGVSGTVDAISFLSVRVHTADNQLVRIPNSLIINNKLKNYATYDYRRYVFEFSVDYSSDLDKTLEAIKQVPARCPTVVTDEGHEPAAWYVALGESGIAMNLIVWCKRADFFQTKSDVCANVAKVCRENGVNIPFNRMDVPILTDTTTPAASNA